ncbi:MAG: PAS domain S-box protein, partial [Nitrospirae bacterium]|nr:PAS domain S-box protein [Nitrospirota bacterium]
NHTVLVSRSGGERVIADSGSPIRDSEGKVIGVVLVFRDITERRLAEEALKRVSRQNELILDAAGEGIFGLDLNGNHTFVNPAAAKMLGYEPDELIGKHSHSTWHHTKTDGTPYPEQECPIYSAFKDSAVHHREDEVFWKKDHTSFNVTYTSTPIIDNEKLVGAVVTFRDITEHRLAEEALRKSEEEYRSLFEESKDVVFISTPEGRFIDINKAGVELFGYSSKKELIEADIEKNLYVHLGYRKELLKILDEQGYVKDYELLMKNIKGDILIVLETATAFRDETGCLTLYRGILRNITHQRKLEQQLMQAQKMEAVGQLAGGIAHDFNNFLTAIIGYGSMLQMGMEKDNPLTPHVQQILSSAERAANLTKQLLIFSRQQIIDPRPVRINEIIFAIEKLLSRLIGEDIELKLTLSPGNPTIRADICQIEQVLMNLATNARDAMPNGGKLMIKTESVVMDDKFMMTCGCGKEGQYVVVTVSDTGEGMDEKTRERIFEPFFTTKEVGKGTGLGLAIIYGIVKQHNGCINVYSEPGEGTSFRIYLPLIEDKVEDRIVSGQPDAIGGTETVLLTEDDSEVRQMVSGLLADFGYTVIEAVDGEDAVEKFREHKDNIHLVILDVIMPKKNGKEAYREVALMKPGIKVIFESGYPADVIRRKGIIEEGVEFISKPFAPSELLKTIRKVLQQ